MGNSKTKKIGRPSIKNGGYGVTFVALKCPRCKSKKIKCYSSRPPVRYHRCKNCNIRFKSIEED